MPVQTSFSAGDPLPASFMNDQQEVQSPSAWGVRLTQSSSTVLTVPLASDGSASGQTVIRINGLPRVIRAPVTLNLVGLPAATYDVYAIASGSTLLAGFTLGNVAHNAAAPALSRKIGEVDWSGTAITAVRNTLDVAGHGYLHRAGGPDPLPTAPAVGLTDATTNTEGTSASYARADHTHQVTTIGAAPIGAIVPYAGTGDPAGGEWIIADGRLIDRTVYAAFFAAAAHAYNQNVDPGSNKVKIPDKRGRSSRGAINMGSAAGAGLNDNAHSQVARGVVGGEVSHQILVSELAPHSHYDNGHNHVNGYATGTGQAYDNVGVPDNGITAPYSWAGQPGYANLANTGGGASHNNLDPYESDAYIVRVL